MALTSQVMSRGSNADYFFLNLPYGRVHSNGDECVQRLLWVLALYGGSDCNGLGGFEYGDVKPGGGNKQGRRGDRTNCSFKLLGFVPDLGYTSCLYLQNDKP